MKLIPSFAVDHTHLQPGIYISRGDAITSLGAKDGMITTYDIRMTAPNQEPAIQPAAMHTIEHLVATYLRNHPVWAERVIYWGPMGCMTGNYLILKGQYDPDEIRPLMIDAFRYVVDYDDVVPGTTPATCGNYLMHDLPMAKWEAARYIHRLESAFCCDYPGIERGEDSHGKTFYDA